jgi:uncharacterized protein YdeI (YjbR/CyaY-like superfamily)
MVETTPTHFKTPAAFMALLHEHHETARALALRISKTHAADTGITYAQSLDEALCYGWINGVRKRLDADSFSVRFSSASSQF